MVIFVGFNFIIFLGIAVGQIVILSEVMKSSRMCNSSNVRRREVALAKSVVAVVLTDLLCWIPIGIIGMLTFCGFDVSKEVYAWILVLVLPINSALNPILYTLSSIVREQRRRKAKEINVQREKELSSREIDRLQSRLKAIIKEKEIFSQENDKLTRQVKLLKTRDYESIKE
ncbi:relaxin receptor 2-like [Saccostrea cucullata]|uniref:relaxin receptor 2-like n=1 Tax=Saccostrea cuccullata TaxID=36930 RepID=UPI002ED49A46